MPFRHRLTKMLTSMCGENDFSQEKNEVTKIGEILEYYRFIAGKTHTNVGKQELLAYYYYSAL